MSFAVSPGGPRTWHQYAKATRSAGGDGLTLSLTLSLNPWRCAVAAAGHRPPSLAVAGADASAVLREFHRRILRPGSAIGHFQNTHQTNQP